MTATKEITGDWLDEIIDDCGLLVVEDPYVGAKIDTTELAIYINQFFNEPDKPVEECEYCQEIHDLRVACPEYSSLVRTYGNSDLNLREKIQNDSDLIS